MSIARLFGQPENQDTHWVIEDILGLCRRRPERLTFKVVRLAIQATGAQEPVTTFNDALGVYGQLRFLVSELDNGRYPTLISRYYDDGLAQEGWQPPPGSVPAPDPQLIEMRRQITEMMQSPYLNKKEVEHLPQDTAECHAYLCRLLAERTAAGTANPALAMQQRQGANMQSQQQQYSPEQLASMRAEGEAVLHRRNQYAYALAIPENYQVPIEFLMEAVNLVKQGDVSLIQAVNAIRAPQQNGPGTIASALEFVQHLIPKEETKPMAETTVAETKAKKWTYAAKMRVKEILEPTIMGNPGISYEQIMTSQAMAKAAETMNTTPHDVYTRLFKDGIIKNLPNPLGADQPAGAPQPPATAAIVHVQQPVAQPQVQVPPPVPQPQMAPQQPQMMPPVPQPGAGYNQMMAPPPPVQQPTVTPPPAAAAPGQPMSWEQQLAMQQGGQQCQGASIAETNTTSPSIPPSSGTMSPVPTMPGAVPPPPMPQMPPATSAPWSQGAPAVMPQANTSQNEMTISSQTTQTWPAGAPAAPVTVPTSIGSPTPSVAAPQTAPGTTSLQPTQLVVFTNGSTLAALLGQRASLLAQLKELDQTINSTCRADLDQLREVVGCQPYGL